MQRVPRVFDFLFYLKFKYYNSTEKKESPHEAKPAWENSSLGLIEVVD